MNQSALNQQEAERQQVASAAAAAAAAAAATAAAAAEEDAAAGEKDDGEGGEGASSCAVCLEDFRLVARAVTPCGHVFCLECIREALFSYRCCPLCRKPTRHSELMIVRAEGEEEGDGDDEGGDGNNGNNNNGNTNAAGRRSSPAAGPLALSTSLIASDLLLDSLRAQHGAKMAAGVVAVAEAAATGGKVVAFSCWSRLLRLFGHALTSAGIHWVSLAGGGSLEARSASLQAFRTDPLVSVLLLLLSTGGGAAGLDLGCASTALLLEPGLNSGLEAQASARIQRLGQIRETRVVRLLSSRTLDVAVATVAAERAARAEEEADVGAEEAPAEAATATAGVAEVVDDRLVSRLLAAHPP